jgi:hypothetical protein
MALNDWPTTADLAATTSTDAESDSINSARADINQTIQNVNGFINSFGSLTAATNGQVLKYDSTQDKFLVADESTGSTPGGSTGYIQYNDAGSLGGDQYFYLANPGGGTNCYLSHQGTLSIGRSAGAYSSAVSHTSSVFQILHDGDDRFAIYLNNKNNTTGLDASGDPAVAIGGDGAIGLYPMNAPNFTKSESAVLIAKGGSSYNNLYVKFQSSGSEDAIIIMQDLPTADPVNAGQLWNDSGTLKVSAG